MSARDNYLFIGPPTAHDLWAAQKQRVETEIAQMDGNRLLNTNEDDLVAYFAGTFRFDLPLIDEENMTVDQKEATRDMVGHPQFGFIDDRRSRPVTGTEVIIELPYTGDGGLFRVRPNTVSSRPPQGEISDDTIVYRMWSMSPSADQLRREIDEWLKTLKQHLQWQENSLQPFNAQIEQIARTAITERRKKLLAAQNVVADLGIRLNRRPGMTDTYSAPSVRRKMVPKMPPASVGAFKPEPTLPETEYQHILEILDGMVKVMERSPKAFHEIDEESLRSHFLVQLNGHYEGDATGETFNYEGKTDILIRSGNRNIFIAECKFWSGPAKLTETIDQLLGYLSWRDSKAAILLFNRNKDFSKVLAAIPEVVRAHPNFQKDEGRTGETRFRYAFRHRDDAAKLLHLTILAFDVPRAD